MKISLQGDLVHGISGPLIYLTSLSVVQITLRGVNLKLDITSMFIMLMVT